jgi:outer membrane protein W
MMKKTVQGLMVLAVCWLSTGTAQPRDLLKDAQADVFVMGGGSTMVDPQTWTLVAPYHSRMDLGLKYSIGVAIPYGKILSIESAYTYGPNNLYVENIDIFPHTKASGSVVEYPVNDYIGSLDAVLHAPFSFMHVQPYGVAGVEYDHFSPTPEAVTEALDHGFGAAATTTMSHSNKLGLNFGVGLDRKLMKRVHFRVDFRDHVSGTPAFGIPARPTTDSQGAAFPVSGRANNLVYEVGLVFHLGKL